MDDLAFFRDTGYEHGVRNPLTFSVIYFQTVADGFNKYQQFMRIIIGVWRDCFSINLMYAHILRKILILLSSPQRA